MPHNATALLLPGGLVAGDIPNLDPMAQALAGFFARIKNPRYAKDCKRHLEVFAAWCVQQNIHDPLYISAMQLEMYLRYLQQTGLSESTIQSRFGAVCVFYHRAHLDDLILKDPSLKVERPTVDKSKQHRTWLSPLEMARILAVAKETGVHEYALCVLMGECGLRVAEACSLRIENITMQGGWKIVRFIGKGGKAARVVLPMAAMRAVEEAIGQRENGPILINTVGRPMTRNTAFRTIKRLAIAADLDPTQVACHTFRRTAAKTAIDLGQPLQKVQQLLRHSDPKTTMQHYVGEQGIDAHASHQVAGFYDSLIA
jgi:site-specific recombinase XerD